MHNGVMELALADKLYSSSEVCNILGVSLRTLYRYIESGDLGSLQTPTGRHRFTKKHMEDFLGKGKRVNPQKEEKLQEEAVQEKKEEEIIEVKEVETEPEIEKEIIEEKIEKIEEEKEVSEGLSLAEEKPEKEEKDNELGGEELVEEVLEIYYKADSPDVRTLAKKVKDTAEKYNIRYAFTGMGGLSLHYPIKPFNNLEVYIQKDDLAIWIAELTLVEATKLSANLKVKFNNDAIDSSILLGGLNVAEDTTLAKDLEDGGFSELAEELRLRKSS